MLSYALFPLPQKPRQKSTWAVSWPEDSSQSQGEVQHGVAPHSLTLSTYVFLATDLRRGGGRVKKDPGLLRPFQVPAFFPGPKYF